MAAHLREEKIPFLPTDEPDSSSGGKRPRKASDLFRIHAPLVLVELVLLVLNVGLLWWNFYPTVYADSNIVGQQTNHKNAFCWCHRYSAFSVNFLLTPLMQHPQHPPFHTKSNRSMSISLARFLANRAMKWMLPGAISYDVSFHSYRNESVDFQLISSPLNSYENQSHRG